MFESIRKTKARVPWYAGSQEWLRYVSQKHIALYYKDRGKKEQSSVNYKLSEISSKNDTM
jgi:hypothetical protein